MRAITVEEILVLSRVLKTFIDDLEEAEANDGLDAEETQDLMRLKLLWPKLADFVRLEAYSRELLRLYLWRFQIAEEQALDGNTGKVKAELRLYGLQKKNAWAKLKEVLE